MRVFDVIIVDDEIDIFKLYEVYMRKEIESELVRLHCFEDGNLVYDQFKKCNFDVNNCVVLCDINMPCINGFDLLQKVRAEYDATFYMVTAYNRDDYRQKAIELGALDLIPKPVNFKELLSIIKDKHLSGKC